MRLKLVKTTEEEVTTINHGTAVIKSFVSPWVGSDRIVCVDAYFASVATALESKRLGLRFIGASKHVPLCDDRRGHI
jgi:hypothetical protein